MKFLALVKSSEKQRVEGPPPALMEAMGRFVQESFASGKVVDTGGLEAQLRRHAASRRARQADGPPTAHSPRQKK